MKSRRTFLKVTGLGSVGLFGCGDDTSADASVDALSDVPSDGPVDSFSPDSSVEGFDAATDSATDSGPYVDDGLAPVLFNYVIRDAQPARVYFDSSKRIVASTTDGFTISGRTITGVTVNGEQLSGHYFDVSEQFSFWDNHTIRYEDGSDLRDPEDRALFPFDLQYVNNEITEPEASASTYFVDGSVVASGDGGSEAAAFKTLQEAADVMDAGTTIWVKAYAGAYGSVTLRGGGASANEPIKVVGYKEAPGDLDGNMYYSYLGVDDDAGVVATEMPLLRGSGGSTGLTIDADFVIVRNLQASDWDEAFAMRVAGTDAVVIDNCLGYTSSAAPDGSGGNFQLSAGGSRPDHADRQHSRIRLTRCIAVNGTTHNYILFADHSMISDCASYQDSRLSGGTDYLYLYRGSDSIYRNLIAHRDDKSEHSGHGYALKSEYSRTEYNLTENCTSYNIYFAIEVRHANVKYNVFRNMQCTKNDAYAVEERDNGGIKFTSASYNIVDNIYVRDGRFGIRFHGSTENDAVGETAGHNNIIKNSVFEGCNWGVSESVDTDGRDRIARDNQIIGCTFHNNDFVAFAARPGTDNKFIGCMFDAIPSGESVSGDPHGFTYENCNFWDLGFTAPDGLNSISADPAYSEFPVPTNAELKAGVASLVKYDKDGKQRADPPTIGAVEI